MSNNLSASDFSSFLFEHNACPDARAWAEGKDFSTAWATCHRGDWLLWLLEAAAPLDDKTNERLICRFAREVVHLTTDPRVLACIEVCEAWARGEATDAERNVAKDAARAAAKDAAKAAAGDAARAAAKAAARAAAGDAAWATARATAGDAARARQADIIRKLVPMPFIAQSL